MRAVVGTGQIKYWERQTSAIINNFKIRWRGKNRMPIEIHSSFRYFEKKAAAQH